MGNRDITEIMKFMEERCGYTHADANAKAHELYNELKQDKRQWVVTKYDDRLGQVYMVGSDGSILRRAETRSRLQAHLMLIRAKMANIRGFRARPITAQDRR